MILPSRVPLWLRGAALVAVGCTPLVEARAEDAPARAPRIFTFASPISTEATTKGVDPARIGGPDDERIVLACYDGLTSLDPITGKTVPAAAASWTTSPDGKTWTFTLRAATWMKREGGAFKEVDPVKASDFTYAWMRLLDLDIRSPSLHMLDGLAGVVALSSDKPRIEAIGRIVDRLSEATGGMSVKKTITPDDMQTILTDPELNIRGWLAGINAPEVRELVSWPFDKPYQGLKVWGQDGKAGVIGALRKETEKSLAVVTEAER